jgi:hypothetical protein
VALADHPTTTADAGGWTESPDQPTVEPQGQNTELPVAPQGTNGLDATGQAIEAEEAHEGNEPPRRPDGRFEKNGFRRRAASQEATPADVPRIQELTRRLRETERERDQLKAGGTPAASNGHAAPAQEPPPTVAPPAPAPRRGMPPPPPPFTLQEPTFDQFKDSPDPLRDYTKAMARFTHVEENHRRAVEWHKEQSQRSVAAQDGELHAMTQAHWQRMAAVAADPAQKAMVEQFANDERPITPAILQAVVRMGENSAKVTMAMLKTPGLLEELTLATYDRPATPELVAIVQRRLQSLGLSAATTGSATAPAPRPAPRPPNPVRTAPEAPPRELPGDDASLADHAAAFHQPRRSRLRRDR